MSERPPILMQRRLNGLAPMSMMDAAGLDRFPYGKALKVTVTRGRSNDQLRLYWSLLDKVAENLDQDVTGDDLHEWLKVKLGYVTSIRLRSGEIAEVPGSVAFDKMDQATFNEYFRAAKALICEHIIPGIGSDALEREARTMLGEAA